MAQKSNSKLVSEAMKLGVTYGPVLYGAVKKSGITPETLLTRQIEKTDARANAYEHADHLIDGSVLTVFEGDRRIFVVFSGDRPVATHPTTRTPLPRLIDGYDLDKRVRPDDEARRSIPLPRLRRRRERPTRPGPRTVGAGPAPVEIPSEGAIEPSTGTSAQG